MTKMINTATILRKKYNYRGYLHLKIMPGASSSTIKESIKLANRISLNIESPTEEDLLTLSPNKTLKRGFFHTLSLIKDELQRFRFASQRIPSLTTQFVVGAGEETDKEIIQKTHLLYKSFGLRRVFYSAFRPVPQTPLEDKPAASKTREHRLYQSDFLMRFYRFSPWDIPLDENGFLPEMTDPKTLWAQKNPQFFPINLNRASYWNLLKVPGIGPTSAKKIMEMRNQRKINSFSDLEGQRFQIKKLADFACL
jgi:predicted DNA-binding helix-hairpin-helix protein